MGTDHIPKTHSFSARSNVTEPDTVSTAHYRACLFVSLIHCKRGHVLPQAGYSGKASDSVREVQMRKKICSLLTSAPRHEGTGKSGGAVARNHNLRTRYRWPASRQACFTPGEKAPSSHYIGPRIRLYVREKRNICCTWPELNHESSSVVQPVPQLFSSSWYRKKKEHAMYICLSPAESGSIVANVSFRWIFLSLPILSHVFPCQKQGTSLYPKFPSFYLYFRTTHVSNSKDEKSRQTKNKDDSRAAFCFACAWHTATFTYLWTSMWSGPTGLSKDARFTTSSSKTQGVQLVKKFPIFYGTQNSLSFNKSRSEAMCIIFVYTGFSCKGFLASRSSTTMQDARDLAATLHTCSSYHSSAIWGCAMLWWHSQCNMKCHLQVLQKKSQDVWLQPEQTICVLQLTRRDVIPLNKYNENRVSLTLENYKIHNYNFKNEVYHQKIQESWNTHTEFYRIITIL